MRDIQVDIVVATHANVGKSNTAPTLTREISLTNLARLRGGPERATVAYQLTVTYTAGSPDTTTCETFAELSTAIDAALASPGFTRYEVGPAGDR